MGRLRSIAFVAGATLLLAAGKAPSPQAVVDRPRLDQKLRRINDALETLRARLAQGDDKVTTELLQEAKSQLEQARAQLAAERSAEAWLNQQLEMAQGAPKTPDAGIPPVRTRDAWGTDVALENRGVAAQPLPSGREPLGEVGLRTLVNAMRGQDFRGGKLRILAQAAPAYVFSVEQVVEILGEFVAPADRLEALQLTVPHLSDRTNAPALYRACASESERSLVRRLLES